MMDNNNQNNNSNNNGPKVVVTTNNVSNVTTVNTNNNNNGQNTAVSAQKSLNDHMADNLKNNKPKVNVMNIFIYILMMAIIAVCVVLLLHFCDSSKLKEQMTSKKTTTTINFNDVETTLYSQAPNYEQTTTIATKATHLAIPDGSGNNSYYNTTNVRTTSTVHFTSQAPVSTPATKASKPTNAGTSTTTTTTTTTTTSSIEVSSGVNEN